VKVIVKSPNDDVVVADELELLLIDRIVVATIEGFLYTEKIPNYCP